MHELIKNSPKVVCLDVAGFNPVDSSKNGRKFINFIINQNFNYKEYLRF